jgi:hypothetical protein
VGRHINAHPQLKMAILDLYLIYLETAEGEANPDSDISGCCTHLRFATNGRFCGKVD